MMDSLLKLIYGWGHRYTLEVGLTVVFFLLIHFVGYPFMASRAVQTEALPSIVTGDINTNGNNSGVVVGGTDADNKGQKK
jgi:hypothetical protein